MRFKSDRISYTITFDVLIESGCGVSECVTKDNAKQIKDLLPYETTIYDEESKPNYLFIRNVKSQRHERTKTEKLFP